MSDEYEDREETREEDTEVVSDERTLESESVEEDGQEPLEKRLKDQQAENTRLQQERAEMRRELDELKGEVRGISSTRQREDAPDPLAEYEREGFDEEFLDKPGEHLRKILHLTGNGFVNLRKEMMSEIQGLKKDLQRSSFDPDTRERIAELRKNPKLANLDDDVLAEVAKTSGGIKRKAREFPGNPPNTSRTQRGGDAPDPVVEKEISEMMTRLGFEGEKKDA